LLQVAAELPRPADGVLICVKPDKVPEVLRQVAAAGIRRVWLQQGAESDAAAKLATELRLDLVQGECILMYAPPVRGFHRLHRGIWRLIGRLAASTGLSAERERAMVKHIVIWRLKDSAAGRGKSDNARLIKEKLEALRGRIPGLLHLEVDSTSARARTRGDVGAGERVSNRARARGLPAAPAAQGGDALCPRSPQRAPRGRLRNQRRARTRARCRQESLPHAHSTDAGAPTHHGGVMGDPAQEFHNPKYCFTPNIPGSQRYSSGDNPSSRMAHKLRNPAGRTGSIGVKGFLLGLLVAALAFGGYLFWQHQRGQAARPAVVTADTGPTPTLKKAKRRGRGPCVWRGRLPRLQRLSRPRPASPNPEPVRLSAADLRSVAQGDDLSTPDVLRLDMSNDKELPELSPGPDRRALPQRGTRNSCRASRTHVLIRKPYVPGRVTIKFASSAPARCAGCASRRRPSCRRADSLAAIKGVVGRLRFPPAGTSPDSQLPFLAELKHREDLWARPAAWN